MSVLQDKEDVIGLRYSLTSLGAKIEAGIEKLITAQEQQQQKQVQQFGTLYILITAAVIVMSAPYLERLINLFVDTVLLQ